MNAAASRKSNAARPAPLGPDDAAAIVRHLGYLHQEVVRHRLYFLVWLIEMALLHMEDDVPSVRADIAPIKARFRF